MDEFADSGRRAWARRGWAGEGGATALMTTAGHVFRIKPLPYATLRKIDTTERWHEVLFAYAVERYEALVEPSGGSALVVCGNERDAHHLQRYPFEEIVVTGFGDRRRDIARVTLGDPRISYQQANAEALPFASRSFDVVVCKEGLHHLPRPVAGLYEMLRCCRKAAIVIEPFESALERALERFGIATCYEREGRGRRAGGNAARPGGGEAAARAAPHINPFERDNYVFRWSRRQLETILNSYYLDSDYAVELTVGWLSKRAVRDRSGSLRELVALAASAAALVPGLRGNLAIGVIVPGSDLPPDEDAMAQAFSTERRVAAE